MAISIWRWQIAPLDLAMGIAFLFWAGIQALTNEPVDPTIHQAFMVILGGWVTVKVTDAKRGKEKVETRVGALEELAKDAHPETATEKGVGQ